MLYLGLWPIFSNNTKIYNNKKLWIKDCCIFWHINVIQQQKNKKNLHFVEQTLGRKLQKDKSCAFLWANVNVSGPQLTSRQNSPKNKTFFARWCYTLYEHKFLNLRSHLSISFPPGFWKSKKFWQWTSESGGKKTIKRSEKQRYQKNHAQ